MTIKVTEKSWWRCNRYPWGCTVEHETEEEAIACEERGRVAYWPKEEGTPKPLPGERTTKTNDINVTNVTMLADLDEPKFAAPGRVLEFDYNEDRTTRCVRSNDSRTDYGWVYEHTTKWDARFMDWKHEGSDLPQPKFLMWLDCTGRLHDNYTAALTENECNESTDAPTDSRATGVFWRID